MSPKRPLSPSALVLGALALFISASCALGPFERSATVELSLSFPEGMTQAPAGLVAAVQDELAADGMDPRVFDQSTAFIRAVISAPDMGRPVVLMAPYEEGPVTLRLVAPVGKERRLEVTALDAERALLTRGEAEFEVTKGLTTISLWMKPVDELLPPEHAIPVGPCDIYASVPDFGLKIALGDMEGGTSYYYADLPVDGAYRFDLKASSPLDFPPETRLYDQEGRRIEEGKPDSAFPGRFSVSAGRIYVAMDKPQGDLDRMPSVFLEADLDWRPTIRGLSYLADPEGELDSRDPLILEFPHDAQGMSFPGGLSFYEYSELPYAIEGKTLTISPPIDSQGIWYSPINAGLVSAFFEDPIISGVERNLETLFEGRYVSVYTYVYVDAMNGSDAGNASPDSPFQTLSRAMDAYGTGSYDEVRYILAEGSYPIIGSISASYIPTILGGFSRSGGAWIPNSAGWSEIVMTTDPDNYTADFTVNGSATVKGISFKHSHELNPSSPPTATVIVTGAALEPASFTRCRFYSPGMKSSTVFSTAAVQVTGSASMVMDRCSVNWPPDENPDTHGGSLVNNTVVDPENVIPASQFFQYGLYVSEATLTAFNSIISGGSIGYDTGLPFTDPPELNALRLVSGTSPTAASLYACTLLSGSAPDDAGYASRAFRHIVSMGTSETLSAIGCLFANQTNLPFEVIDVGWDAYGISESEASFTVESCAFSRLVAASGFSLATSSGLPAGSLDLSASFDAGTLKPSGGPLLLDTAVPESAFGGLSPEQLALLAVDFYGTPRLAGGVSVGAVEYR